MSEEKAESGPVMERKIRVLLADDHPSIRRMLVIVLEDERDIEIVGQAVEGRDAVRLARELRPDVLLMDVSMPEMDGVAATRILHAELPEVRILGLTVFDEDNAGDAMRQAGAVGFLSKSEAVTKLAEAIRKCVMRDA